MSMPGLFDEIPERRRRLEVERQRIVARRIVGLGREPTRWLDERADVVLAEQIAQRRRHDQLQAQRRAVLAQRAGRGGQAEARHERGSTRGRQAAAQPQLSMVIRTSEAPESERSPRRPRISQVRPLVMVSSAPAAISMSARCAAAALEVRKHE